MFLESAFFQFPLLKNERVSKLSSFESEGSCVRILGWNSRSSTSKQRIRTILKEPNSLAISSGFERPQLRKTNFMIRACHYTVVTRVRHETANFLRQSASTRYGVDTLGLMPSWGADGVDTITPYHGVHALSSYEQQMLVGLSPD